MTRLNITLATGHYDRVLPLKLGEIEADGIELNHLLMPVKNALSVAVPPRVLSNKYPSLDPSSQINPSKGGW